MLGETDLNPSGLHLHPPGRRLPSMMAPTLVRRADGAVELALGSAGSNRIRSAILQVICNVVDRGMGLAEAVEAPRLHWEDGVLYVEPGAEPTNLKEIVIARFNGPSVFFGGCQAVRRDPDSGRMAGAGDPRRGGAVIAVSVAATPARTGRTLRPRRSADDSPPAALSQTMSATELAALLMFCTAMTFSPGPNTTLSTALAANHGLEARMTLLFGRGHRVDHPDGGLRQG